MNNDLRTAAEALLRELGRPGPEQDDDHAADANYAKAVDALRAALAQSARDPRFPPHTEVLEQLIKLHPPSGSTRLLEQFWQWLHGTQSAGTLFAEVETALAQPVAKGPELRLRWDVETAPEGFERHWYRIGDLPIGLAFSMGPDKWGAQLQTGHSGLMTVGDPMASAEEARSLVESRASALLGSPVVEPVVVAEDVALTLARLDDSDWWAIVRLDAADQYPSANPFPAYRIGNRTATVEGTAAEMLSIAHAIRDRGSDSHKRCAVEWTLGGVRLWSPRNSNDDIPTVTHEQALALAIRILTTLGADADALRSEGAKGERERLLGKVRHAKEAAVFASTREVLDDVLRILSDAPSADPRPEGAPVFRLEWDGDRLMFGPFGIGNVASNSGPKTQSHQEYVGKVWGLNEDWERAGDYDTVRARVMSDAEAILSTGRPGCAGFRARTAEGAGDQRAEAMTKCHCPRGYVGVCAWCKSQRKRTTPDAPPDPVHPRAAFDRVREEANAPVGIDGAPRCGACADGEHGACVAKEGIECSCPMHCRHNANTPEDCETCRAIFRAENEPDVIRICHGCSGNHGEHKAGCTDRPVSVEMLADVLESLPKEINDAMASEGNLMPLAAIRYAITKVVEGMRRGR